MLPASITRLLTTTGNPERRERGSVLLPKVMENGGGRAASGAKSGQPRSGLSAARRRPRATGPWMGTTVTCPTWRYNPAVVAETFASLGLLYPGRIFLGVGSGGALNEQAATGA